MRRLFLIWLTALIAGIATAQQVIDLTGPWDFAVGDTAVYKDFVVLPGSMETNGKAEQTERMWFQRGIYVPLDWRESRVTLFLERPSGETTVYVNDGLLGSREEPFTPHIFDLTRLLVPGQRNLITVSMTSPKGCWQGISGRVEMRSQPRDLYIERVKLNPHPFMGVVNIDLQLTGRINYLNSDVVAVLLQRADVDSATVVSRYFSLDGRQVNLVMPFEKEVALWDEFHPHLYRIAIAVGDDYFETTFGMQETMLLNHMPVINGHEIFLRGVVNEGQLSPTGFAATDVEAWLETFRACKNYGFNNMRFKGYCPPEAAFTAADKLGFYLLPEVQGDEVARVIDVFGQHPSFLMMGPACYPDSLRPVIQEIPLSKLDNDSSRLCYYKHQIEGNLLGDSVSGFEVQDFAEVRSHFTPNEWRQFCSSVVPLVHFPHAKLTPADTLCVPVAVYNAMGGDLRPIRASYYITDEKRQVLLGGQLPPKGIPLGKQMELGTICVPLDSIAAPQKLTLTLTLGSRIANSWEFMISPAPEPSPAIKPEETM